MEIIREGDQWLAPQKVTAAFFEISVQAFQRWNYEPVRRDGRRTLYDVRAILNDREGVRVGAASDLDLTAERARLAKAQADKTEQDVRKTAGELIEVSEVRTVVASGINGAKTRILSIPARYAGQLENKTAKKIDSILTGAIHEALEDLSLEPFGALETAKKAKCKRVVRRGKVSKPGK